LYERVFDAYGKRRGPLISQFAQEAERLVGDAEKLRSTVTGTSVYSSPEAPDELLEYLTGTWLALYFLACPSIHPWEAVAFFAEGSGFPRGASLCKAVGDVYRGARKTYLRDRAREDATALKPVYVLDHNPLTLKQIMDLLARSQNCADKTAVFRLKIAFLGMMYERLQLALYLHAGGPIYFYVPRSSLRKALMAKPKDLPQDEVDERKELTSKADFMHEQLLHCFPTQYIETQFVLIVEDEALSYMPGCVLGPTEGIFRTRNVRGDFSLVGRAGNYLPTRVFSEFANKLQKLRPEKQAQQSLQTLNSGTFRAICDRITHETEPAFARHGNS
jgi:hypothetical protein